MVKQQVELAESAGLRLTVIDVPELCLRKGLRLETAHRLSWPD